MEQAQRDAGDRKMPIVAHKRNGREWLCIIRADDMFALLRETNQPLTTQTDNDDKDKQGDGEGSLELTHGTPAGQLAR
jgi:hypothetical protein